MSDRRPHWTDELINAVIDLQYHCVDCMEDDYPDIDPRNHDAVNAAWACEVIAAVEDWARWEHVPKGTLRRLEQAEAAIARVRERAGGPIPAVHGDWMAGYAAAMRDILSALDGER